MTKFSKRISLQDEYVIFPDTYKHPPLGTISEDKTSVLVGLVTTSRNGMTAAKLTWAPVEQGMKIIASGTFEIGRDGSVSIRDIKTAWAEVIDN